MIIPPLKDNSPEEQARYEDKAVTDIDLAKKNVAMRELERSRIISSMRADGVSEDIINKYIKAIEKQ